MVQTDKLCETLGLDSHAFFVHYNHDNTPYLMTMVECGRQVPPSVLESENKTLEQVEKLYGTLIKMMQDELSTIAHFREQFYGTC